MKSNWIKYIFIVFIILILVFSIYKIKQDEHQEQEVNISNKQKEIVKELKLGIAGLDTINPILSKNKNRKRSLLSLFPVSCLLIPTSYFLLPNSYFLFPNS